MPDFGVGKLKKKARDVTGDLLSPVNDFFGDPADLVQQARTWLEENASAVTESAGAVRDLATGPARMGTRIVTQPVRQAYLTARAAGDIAGGDPSGALDRFLSDARDTAEEIRRQFAANEHIGAIVRAPVTAAAARITGVDEASDWLDAANTMRLAQAAKENDNPFVRAGARAAIGGLKIGTNPTTYAGGALGTVRSAVGATGIEAALPGVTRAGAMLTGVGGFGGKTAGAQIARAAGVLGGAELGREFAAPLLEHAGVPEGIAEEAAALVGGVATFEGARRLPRGIPGSATVRGLFTDAEHARTNEIVPRDVARELGPVRMPDAPAFRRAVEVTPGASVDAEGLHMDVTRFQKREQSNVHSPRTGVFYAPTSQSARYENSMWGGPQRITGETTFRRPLVVQGRGGGLPGLFGFLTTEGEGTRLQELAHRAQYAASPAERLAAVREAFRLGGIDPALADRFVKLVPEQDIAPALTERVGAEHARRQGYDSVVVYDQQGINEAFDLREPAYPTPSGRYTLDPRFRGAVEGTGELRGGSLSRGDVRAADAALGRKGGYGKTATAFGITDPSATYDFRYRVVPLDELVTSHHDSLIENVNYPQELQQRLRDRAASDAQIERIAQKLSPDQLLTDSRILDRGAPIIGSDNLVESGNGRTLALRRAREKYPERFSAYQDELHARADEFGLDPAVVGEMKDPVLVRERVSPVDRPAFAKEANARPVAGMSPVEAARADAGLIRDDWLAQLDVPEEATIDAALTSRANRHLLDGFLDALPEAERGELLTTEGKPGRAAVDRLKAALFARTYGTEQGQRLLGVFTESLDPGIRNIEHGLFASLPDIAHAEALVRTGDRDGGLSIARDVAIAVDMLHRLRANEMSVADYIGQAAMFGERETTPFQDALIAHFDANRRSPKQIRELLKAYADGVEASPDPRVPALFAEPLDKEGLLDAAARRAGQATDFAGSGQGAAGPAGGAQLAQPRPGTESAAALPAKSAARRAAAPGAISKAAARRIEDHNRAADAIDQMGDTLPKAAKIFLRKAQRDLEKDIERKLIPFDQVEPLRARLGLGGPRESLEAGGFGRLAQNPALRRTLAGSVAGGVAGGLVPADSEEERARNIAIGMMGGAGVTFAAPYVHAKALRPIGHAVADLVAPALLAPEARNVITTHRGEVDAARIRALPVSERHAVYAREMIAGAQVDQKVANDLIARAVAADAAAGGAPVREQQMRALMGSFRDIMEHPTDYQFTPAAQKALRLARDGYDDLLKRETRAGVWDRKRNEYNEKARTFWEQGQALGRQIQGRYTRAQREIQQNAGPLRSQAQTQRDFAQRLRTEGYDALFGGAQRVAGTPAARGRITERSARALQEALAATNAAEDWHVAQVESLAQRAMALAQRAEVKGQGKLAKVRAARSEAVDTFAADLAAGVPTGRQAAQAERYARAAETLSQHLSVLDAPLIAEMGQITRRARRIYEAANKVALEPQRAETRAHLHALKRELDAAGIQADQAIASVQGRARAGFSADARAFDAMAQIADRQAVRLDRQALATETRIGKAATREMTSMQRRLMKANLRAKGYWEQVQKPVKEYVPHAYEGDPIVGGRVRTIGGQAGFTKERAYPDYRAAALDGMPALTDDAAELYRLRALRSAKAVADRGIVDYMQEQARRPLAEATVVPDFLMNRVRTQLGAKAAEDFVALRDVRLSMADAKDVQAALARNLIGSSNLPAGMSKRDMAMLQGRISRGDIDFFVRKPVAKVIDGYAGAGSLAESKFGRGLEQITGGARALRLGADIAMVMRLIPQAMIAQAAINPLRGYRAWGALGAALRDSLTVEGRRKLIRSERYAEWGNFLEGQVPGDLGYVIDRPEQGLAVEKFWEAGPGRLGEKLAGPVGRAVGEGPVSLEKWQFGVLVPALKFHFAEASLKSLRGVPMYRGLPETALMADIGNRINTTMSGFSRVRAGVSRDMEWFNRLGMLSPTWARGAVANLTDVAKSGPEGYMARMFWGGMATMGVATAVGLSLAFENDYSLLNLQRKLDPRSPESITNPSSPNFLRVDLFGNLTDMWGPITPIARALLRPVEKGIATGVEAAQDDPSYAGLWGAIGEGLLAAGGESESVRDWVEGRRSLPVGLALDIQRNKDFQNHVIATGESGGDRAMQRAKFAGLQLVPGVGGVGLDTQKSAEGEWNTSTGNLVRGLGQFAGLNVKPPPEDPPEVAAKVSRFLLANGIDPGLDPVGTYRSTDKIGGSVRDIFLRENKDVADYIVQKRQQRAENLDVPRGTDAIALYQNKVDGLKAWRDAELKRVYDLFADPAHPVDGPTFRAMRSDVMSKYNAGTEALGAAYLGSRDYAGRQAKIDEAFGGRDPSSDPVDRAMNALQSIEPANPSRAAMTDFARRRRAFLATGKLTDAGGAVVAEFPPATLDALKKYLDARITSPVERQYQYALTVYGELSEISPWRTVPVELVPQIQAALDRAADAKKYGAAQTEVAALMQDRSLPTRVRMLATRVLTMQVANPARHRFIREHTKELAPFFSDLSQEQLVRIGAA